MNDKRYLLTYQDSNNPGGTFAWFDTEEELFEFMNNVIPIEALYIVNAESLLE